MTKKSAYPCVLLGCQPASKCLLWFIRASSSFQMSIMRSIWASSSSFQMSLMCSLYEHHPASKMSVMCSLHEHHPASKMSVLCSLYEHYEHYTLVVSVCRYEDSFSLKLMIFNDEWARPSWRPRTLLNASKHGSNWSRFFGLLMCILSGRVINPSTAFAVYVCVCVCVRAHMFTA